MSIGELENTDHVKNLWSWQEMKKKNEDIDYEKQIFAHLANCDEIRRTRIECLKRLL